MPTGDLANRKSHSYKYNLKVNGVLTQVCRGVFLKVFGITDNRVKRINKCSVLHKSPLDMRGQSRSGNALPGNVCVSIQQHIEKFGKSRKPIMGENLKIILTLGLMSQKCMQCLF